MSQTIPVRYLSLATLILSLAVVSFALDKAGGEGPRAGAGETTQPRAQSAGPAAEAPGGSTPAAAPQSPVIVARIGEYTITLEELADRLRREIRPQEEEELESQPVTVEGVLRTMLAEKAMSMEGRRLGYLQDEIIQSSVKQFEQQQLVRMLADSYLRANLKTDEAEVERRMKADPKLTHARAVALVQRAAANQAMEEFYGRLTAQFHLQKVKENFAQAAQIHQRLLLKPAQPRGQGESWIKNSQVRDELSEQEKDLVLATYDGGKVTLRDWFTVLCNVIPPRRPTDLGTPAGVEKLLDRVLPMPIFVAEARRRGYDKDPKLRESVKALEDQRLLYKVRAERMQGLPEPTPEQIRACFDKNQERFGVPATLKIDQIWCEDRSQAEKLKELLAGGADFAAVKKDHSLEKNAEPHDVSARGEGLFWADLWKAEPNQVVGPLRGFYRDGINWRLVKILGKTPGKVQPYSEQLATRVKWALLAEQHKSALAAYEKELLAKYPYEIYGDKIKGLDPLEVAATPGSK
jgi:hypothetical protein